MAVEPPGVQVNIPMELVVCALPLIVMSANGRGKLGCSQPSGQIWSLEIG